MQLGVPIPNAQMGIDLKLPNVQAAVTATQVSATNNSGSDLWSVLESLLRYSCPSLTFTVWALLPLAFLALPAVHSQSLGLPVKRQDAVRNVLDPDFDQFVQQILDDWNVSAGLGVAIVQKKADDTWLIETKGYGIAKGDGSNVTEDTYFSIGSNTKTFTAMATGLLVSNESLSLSWKTKIASILPEWGLNDSYATSHSTILDLMGHRVGLPRHDLMYEANFSSSDMVRHLQPSQLAYRTRLLTFTQQLTRIKHLKPSAEFREDFQYDSNMYTVLSYLPQHLIPSVSSYARFVKDNIFVPLGLNQTTFDSISAEKSGNLAQGFVRDKVNKTENIFGRGTPRVLPYWNPSTEDGNMISGAGGAIMSVKDAAIWLQSLLLLGQNPATGEAVIPPEVVETTASGLGIVFGTAPWPEWSPMVYGGGQFGYSYRGHNALEHTGGATGFLSVISRFPFDNVGISVFCNDGDFGDSIMQVIKSRIADKVFGLEPVDWNARYKAQVSAQFEQIMALPQRPSEPADPSAPFSSIAGVYNDLAYGRIELCLVTPQGAHNVTQSDSCRALVDDVPTKLPDVDTSIPTFVAKWDKLWSTHLVLRHFDGNLFNGSALFSTPILNSSLVNASHSQTYFTQSFETLPNAEFAIEDGKAVGFGLTGVWEAGTGIEDPSGDTVQERSEVWFAREQ
ncbi:hypothetical protein D9758_001587 [Tetrapyrgos nigripes]|uniref:Beta-lactamase-related domain-containing protein n=1 Tax=Tetrapyrgos nigripes TaxID=182062 RepID=A0A8H5GXV5_9AGAR|nr:hypothetical protein D9758_001587 [Tetrapyrgos nigripes]